MLRGIVLLEPMMQGCNVVAYRWIKKAKANIKAVEKGMFGVGH